MIKEQYLNYLSTLVNRPITANKRIEELQLVYNYDINSIIIPSLKIPNAVETITLNTSLLTVIKAFFEYQEGQYKKGEIDTLTSYRARTVKLNEFLSRCKKAFMPA